MTKDRRAELRENIAALMKQHAISGSGEFWDVHLFTLYADGRPDRDVEITLKQFSALLDSDERLEEIKGTADEMFAEHRSQGAFREIGGKSRARFEDLLKLQPNWDSYGSKAPDPVTLKRAESFLEWYGGAPEPSVVPLSDGGVQIEWHLDGQDLEIEFRPSGQDAASWDGSPLQAVTLLFGLNAVKTPSTEPEQE